MVDHSITSSTDIPQPQQPTHTTIIMKTFVVLFALIALASAGAVRDKRSGWSDGWSGGWSSGWSAPSASVIAVDKVVHVNKVVDVPQVVNVRKVVSVPQVVTVKKIISEPISSGWSSGSSGWW